MSVLDINNHPVGTVARILANSFVLRTPAGEVEVGREALYSVGQMNAVLVCNASRLDRYVVPAR